MMALVLNKSNNLTPLAGLIDDAKDYAANSTSPQTRRLYERAWQEFTAFCRAHDLSPLPAEAGTLAAYVAHLARLRRKPATVDVKVAAIAYWHRQAGHSFDRRLLSATVKGFKRKSSTAQRKASPLVTSDIIAMAAVCEDDLKGKRDRGLILIGFAAALRRSELSGLDVSSDTDGDGYIEFTSDGLLITLKRSKADQEGQGQTVAVPFTGGRLCPVAALQDWLHTAGIERGPVFRGFKNRHCRAFNHLNSTRLSGRAVGNIVCERARMAGLTSSNRNISAHSLRAGFATQSGRAGVDLDMARRQTRHAKLETLLGYMRDGDLFGERNAVRHLGLDGQT